MGRKERKGGREWVIECLEKEKSRRTELSEREFVWVKVDRKAGREEDAKRARAS